jgi:hypothetical protein
MHYTKLISEEHFTAGRPLVIVLPLTEEGTTNEETGYLIEELHTSGRWPILVYNVSYEMKGNMYTEIHQDGSYIILTSGPCLVRELCIKRFEEQLSKWFWDNNRMHSWNPRANFLVPVMSNCTQFDNRNISSGILHILWNYNVVIASALFLKPNEQAGIDLEKNTTDSVKCKYLELHTWYPYENSDRCIPARGTESVKVLTMRNLSEFRRSDIFRGRFDKNFHGCPISVGLGSWLVEVYSTRDISNSTKYKEINISKLESELLNLIGKALNTTPQLKSYPNVNENKTLHFRNSLLLDYTFDKFYHLNEYTRSYFSVSLSGTRRVV